LAKCGSNFTKTIDVIRKIIALGIKMGVFLNIDFRGFVPASNGFVLPYNPNYGKTPQTLSCKKSW